MLRLMVQGGRDATGIEDTVRELGTLCKERGIGLNVGEAGEIFRLLAGTGTFGTHVRVYMAKDKHSNAPEGFSGELIECNVMGRDVQDRIKNDYYFPDDPPGSDRLAWAIRLACFAASNGFIFFPGREGTLAHLVPIMAFIAKGERDKGASRPRRVALVDWPNAKKDAILELFNIGDDDEWIGSFTINEMPKVITWLVDGLPAK